ncbi:MAG: hypothetical protein JSS32_09005 [Verrucomicrobia bacterium]|nr:hypothetical protein [Verrucomicrobiota bacterium]
MAAINNSSAVRLWGVYGDNTQSIERPQLESLDQLKQREFLRRIPREHLSEIVTKIELQNHVISDEELTAFHKGQWDHPLFQDENWTLYAFQAHLENRLTVNQVSKLFLYASCLKQARSDIQVAKEWGIYEKNEDPIDEHLSKYQLFDENGNSNHSAIEALKKATRTYLNEDQFDSLLTELRTLPPEETQFFSIERAMPDRDDKVYFTITVKQDGGLGHEFLTLQRGITQVVPSPDLLYRIFKAKCGENAMKPNAAIGYFPRENLSNPSQRVLFIPCPLIPTSTGGDPAHPRNFTEVTHGAPCSPISVFHHDIYHLFLESANIHRPLWVEYAHFLKAFQKAEMYREEVLDREFDSYLRTQLQKKPISGPDQFWIALSGSTLRAPNEVIEFRTDLFLQFFNQNRKVMAEQGITLESLYKFNDSFCKDEYVAARHLLNSRFLNMLQAKASQPDEEKTL